MPLPAFDMPDASPEPADQDAPTAVTAMAPAGNIWAVVFDQAAADRPELPIRFQFQWGERTVSCRVDEHDAALYLHAAIDFGAVPYSSEQPERRARLSALCHPRFRLPHGDFARTDAQHIVYSAQVELHEPTTGSDVVAAITGMLLLGKPYFSLIEAGADRQRRVTPGRRPRRRLGARR